MRNTQSAVVMALRQVQDFMTTHADQLGNLNESDARTALDDVEATLSGYAASQTSARGGRKAAIARQSVLKNALLVKYLRPIAAIAEAQLDHAPDFAELTLPKPLSTISQLLAAATAMGNAAAKYRDTFVKAGMTPTFLAELEAAANALQHNTTSKSKAVSSHIGATSGLKVATKQAHKVVKQLNALIEAQLASNPALLAQWKATKRFTGRAQPVAGTTISSAGTVAVAPAPAAAVTAPVVSAPEVAVPGTPAAVTASPAANATEGTK
jgi:hypothetical protein